MAPIQRFVLRLTSFLISKRKEVITIKAIFKCVAGLDVHKKQVTCTVIQESIDGKISKTTKEFSTFRSELKKMSQWLNSLNTDLAVMESTGIFWKSVYEVLEDFEIPTYVVNARHIKSVPGRKTDVIDSDWLAELGRCGLLRPSFIPERDLRELRMITRYRRKLTNMRSAEKNRLQKILDDSGVRLSCVVSDIDGVSARSMIEALIENRINPQQIADLAIGRLKKKREDILLSLDGRLSDRHRFLLKEIQGHIKNLNEKITEIDDLVVKAMSQYEKEWHLLQTIPGIDSIGAAILLAEIGIDMNHFGNKDKLSSWAGMCPGNNESAGKKKAVDHEKLINT